MSAQSVEDQIRTRIEEFVDELTRLVRESALSAFEQALGTARPAANAAKRKPPARAASAPPAGGGRGRASAASIVERVSAEPGLRVDELAKGLGTTSATLQPLVRQLLQTGDLRTEGQRRGTRYFPGDGTPPAAATGRKKKRAARKGRRKAARKAGRRKTAAKSAA
jgi:hypothetical protein